jgi:hypothetical protein
MHDWLCHPKLHTGANPTTQSEALGTQKPLLDDCLDFRNMEMALFQSQHDITVGGKTSWAYGNASRCCIKREWFLDGTDTQYQFLKTLLETLTLL